MAKENRELFPIGEVAKMFRVSVGTLRHYEKIGLLAPEFVAPDTGYRYYSTRQLECLNTIRYLRGLEMPLEQIREFLQNREVEKIQEMLQQQKEVVVQKQRALEIVQRKIENRLRQIQDALASELDVIRQVPADCLASRHPDPQNLSGFRALYSAAGAACAGVCGFSGEGRRGNLPGAAGGRDVHRI